jgi:PAS domain S-box-containing protein
MISVLTDKTKSPGKAATPNESDNFLKAIVDACVSNVAVLDESGNILYASKAWRLVQQATAISAKWLEMAPYYFESCKRLTKSEADKGAEISLKDDLQGILFGEEKEFHRQYYCRASREQRPFVMHAARLNLPGLTFRVLITHEDMPVAQEEVKRSEKRLTQLLETTKILTWEADVRDLRFTQVSAQAVKMFGYPANTWCEPNFLASRIHPDDRQRVITAYRNETQVKEHFDLTFRMLAADGRVLWVQNLVSVTADNGKPTRMHGFLIDISDRKRAEESLKHLSRRLIAAQEEERKRVARELHDDLNQRMAVMSIELEQLGQGKQLPASFRKNIQKLQSQAQEISSDIHRLSYKLHPAKLDHLGLAAAVKGLCDELPVAPNGKPRAHFHQSGFPADIPKDAALCIFRIAQEVLRNCVKHSGAESAQVVLTKTDRAIRLSVSDNGCGFDTESDLMEKGLGFISMKERLRIVGGEIKICSQPLHGTRIDVSVPLNSEAESSDYC